MNPGEFILDMHGTNLARLVNESSGTVKTPTRTLMIRNPVEFVLPDVGAMGSKSGHHIHNWMVEACLLGDTFYSNKYLIVLSDVPRDGWYPAGYLYDGRRVGFCEVKPIEGDA